MVYRPELRVARIGRDDGLVERHGVTPVDGLERVRGGIRRRDLRARFEDIGRQRDDLAAYLDDRLAAVGQLGPRSRLEHQELDLGGRGHRRLRGASKVASRAAGWSRSSAFDHANVTSVSRYTLLGDLSRPLGTDQDLFASPGLSERVEALRSLLGRSYRVLDGEALLDRPFESRRVSSGESDQDRIRIPAGRSRLHTTG